MRMPNEDTVKHTRLGRRTAWQSGWLAALLAVLAAGGAAGVTPKRVLLLHSYGRGFEPFQSVSETFRTELVQQLGEPAECYDVPLESTRFAGAGAEEPLIAYLAALFAGHQPDLVVPLGGPATRFAQKHRQQLFPSTPMLIAGMDQRNVQAVALTTNDAVVAVAHDLPGMVEHILRVLPETTNVVVVLGNSPIEKFWLGEMRREFQPFTNRVTLAWLNELSFAQMEKGAAALPPRSAVYYALLSVDAEGIPYTEERALSRLHAVANAPIFGLYNNQMGRGIVGGPLLGVEDAGRNAAKVAVRILRGESAGSIKAPVQVPGTPVYDWRELKRWGISEARLPTGSVIRFRQPTAWEQYKGRMIGLLALCLLEALLIVLLLMNLVRRRRAKRALRESEERLNLATAAADIGVWAWDMGDNRVWVSANWRRMFGVPPEADIGFETVF